MAEGSVDDLPSFVSTIQVKIDASASFMTVDVEMSVGPEEMLTSQVWVPKTYGERLHR